MSNTPGGGPQLSASAMRAQVCALTHDVNASPQNAPHNGTKDKTQQPRTTLRHTPHRDTRHTSIVVNTGCRSLKIHENKNKVLILY